MLAQRTDEKMYLQDTGTFWARGDLGRGVLDKGEASGQRAGAEHDGKVLDLLLGEPSFKRAGITDASVDLRRREHPTVEHAKNARRRLTNRGERHYGNAVLGIEPDVVAPAVETRVEEANQIGRSGNEGGDVHWVYWEMYFLARALARRMMCSSWR